MKLADLKDILNREITWMCISASSDEKGAVTLQAENADKTVEVTLSKSADGSGFESSEEVFTEMTMESVIERIMKINAVTLVKNDDDESCFSFDDDADISGREYEISFGVDEYIVVSITGCDFQSKSVNTFLKVITSIFPEGKEVLDFINGDY